MIDVNVLHLNQFVRSHQEYTFYANTLPAHLLEHHQYIERPHKHEFDVLVLFTHGVGTHTIDFVTYDVFPGALFLLSEGQIHSWNLSEDIDGYIFFHGVGFYTNTENYTLPFKMSNSAFRMYSPLVDLCSSGRRDAVISLFANIFQEYKDGGLAQLIYLQTLVVQVYLEVARMVIGLPTVEVKQINTYFEHYLKFESLVDRHYRVEKAPSFYAKELHMSGKHLNRVIQEVMGITASEYILGRVILEAKRMLIYSKESIAQIADRLGFEDYVYFSHFFKKRTGWSPLKFQKLNR